jgi:catechol 2,3-dioxygenase-like lactoylglutathione lyase family enzyme
MHLQNFYPVIVTHQIIECRDFYRRWFGLEVVFEASWFVLLGTAGSAGATIAFMRPDHPSAPPGPEPFSGKGMCLEFQVADAQAECERFVRDGAALSLALRDEPFASAGSASSIPRVCGSMSSSKSNLRLAGGTSI